ncbi:hypothetical protein LDENG_00275320 [Lucifuga dentata]|nr:hypothetical protein LDENG_00275320 [Lucifuga dentata]
MEKVESTEAQVWEHESRISCLEKTLSSLKAENSALMLKVDDLEGQSRHNNIKILGIPERKEGTRPAEFVEAPDPAASGGSKLSIPACHRSSTLDPATITPGGSQTPHHYHQGSLFLRKGAILRLRREQELEYKGHNSVSH